MPPKNPGSGRNRNAIPHTIDTELTPQAFWELYNQDRLQLAQKLLIMLGIPKKEQDQDQQMQIATEDLEKHINNIWTAIADSDSSKTTFETIFAPNTSFEKASTPVKLAFILYQVMGDMVSASYPTFFPYEKPHLTEDYTSMVDALEKHQRMLQSKIDALKQCANWPNCTDLLQQATTTETTSPIFSILAQFSPLWDMIEAKQAYKEKLKSST